MQVSFCGLKGHAIRDSIWVSLHPLLHALLSSGCVVDVCEGVVSVSVCGRCVKCVVSVSVW